MRKTLTVMAIWAALLNPGKLVASDDDILDFIPVLISAANSQSAQDRPTPVDPPDTQFAKPGPDNTGPTNPSLFRTSGSITVSSDWSGGGSGTPSDPFIVENIDISGRLKIETANVIVRNFRIRGDALYPLQANSDEVDNLLVEDGEIMGGRTKTSAPIIAKNGVTLRRLEIHESRGDGVKVQGSNFTMEGCWVYDLGAGKGAHADGLQGTVTAGRWSNHVYRGNFFDMAVDELEPPYKSNATIFLHIKNDETGTGIDGILIENNWLIGGNYSLPISNGMTDVVIRNNKFGRRKQEVRFGNLRIGSEAQISGNTYEDGELLPDQQ